MFFKKLTVPQSNETKQVNAVQLWEVRWTSRNGPFYDDTQPEVEVFPSEEEAKEFGKSLQLAFQLIRHSGEGTEVQVNKFKGYS